LALARQLPLEYQVITSSLEDRALILFFQEILALEDSPLAPPLVAAVARQAALHLNTVDPEVEASRIRYQPSNLVKEMQVGRGDFPPGIGIHLVAVEALVE
jgi:hypothetical protein